MERVADADLTSPALADAAGERLGRQMSAAGARKALQRAHGHFGVLLVAEVARSLEDPTPIELELEAACARPAPLLPIGLGGMGSR